MSNTSKYYTIALMNCVKTIYHDNLLETLRLFCIATSNRCLTSSNKKLVVTSASLLVDLTKSAIRSTMTAMAFARLGVRLHAPRAPKRWARCFSVQVGWGAYW